ncbi:hypothetical protein SAMN04488120_10746 [Fontimonas thermophila]|uniref:DUF2062 domain-containing protein n=1 Tax=Fontimonas thermophila TaxID=1076937 RepID=A0A1I2JJW5_9GAMM|nr:DUF2062 domain-containing protein [Fontimonas thermophila]SFF52981.1 hypothetical protein SAMN04488120_10746 [Fontimonas thermophila]
MNGTATTSPWRRYVVAPILAQLRQGISPQQIALTLALGTALGIFPILGATTLLCLIAGIWLRLNQPILQLVNYLVYPLQIALLVPFYRAGEWLFGLDPVPILAVTDLIARFQADPLQFVIDYGKVALCGIAVWMLIAPACALALYAVAGRVLRATAARLDLHQRR